MSNAQTPTASLLIIGNEILSGRTQDKNLNWIAQQLSELGIRLTEVRVIPDIAEEIISTVNAMRAKFTYLFTTGGIGPTHDDITTACVAQAFGVKVIRHPEAERMLTNYYSPEMRNEARMRMADVPEGAELVPNPISVAPGYRIENVFVMAGVPSIMQAMFGHIRGVLTPGAQFHSRSLRVMTGEGSLATLMRQVQEAHPQLDVGSYPFTTSPGTPEARFGTSIVVRGTDRAAIDSAIATLEIQLKADQRQYQEE